eukprot:CAMPEP_0204101332 /NCGR_PEP_ID=MMETSP0360-20130528/194420_1 /ASSEMBLY_ACC=CAM_ASM_000342 /TAXON_ID=268821 /ORGANISM="Scrippsiella Hangoei, Strain SHTV-5" /LENGTH=81 /DNA_ID=CAMNT_0051050737 /DNA_START=324 /DNA_END=569 /DNA_ORIENTATION=-
MTRPAQALHMVWPPGNRATTFVNSKQTGHSAEAPEGSRCGASSCSGTPGRSRQVPFAALLLASVNHIVGHTLGLRPTSRKT